MPHKKKFTQPLILILITSMLFGCATTNHGNGIIVAEQKTNPMNDRQERIKHNAKTIGTIGAIGGGALAGSFILGIGILEGSGLASTLGGAAIFAAAGGLTFGLIGAVVGGSAGYIIEQLNSKSEMYQYTVKSLQDASLFTIKQYSGPIPLNTKVTILERNGSLFIKKT